MKNDYCWKIHSLGIADKLKEVYYTVDISENDMKRFCNTSFDQVLKCIGKDYKVKTGSNEDFKSLYSYAYDAIVSDANIGKWKKRNWKCFISKNQIKALRKAYRKILSKNERFFVKIPFNTIQILNTIHILLLRLNENDRTVVRDFCKNDILSKVLAKEHISLFKNEYNAKPELENIKRARNLWTEIRDLNQLANMPFEG